MNEVKNKGSLIRKIKNTVVLMLITLVIGLAVGYYFGYDIGFEKAVSLLTK
jgi:ABC-type phosphate transport system permease subunit